MARIEYRIHYDERTKTSMAAMIVLGVSKDDMISFSSDYPGTVIKYVGDSPFSGGKGPQAGEEFPLGNGQGPFKVTKQLTKELRFKCGEQQEPPKGKSLGTRDVAKPSYKWWPGGGGTRP